MTKIYIHLIEALIILGLIVMVALTFTSAMIRFVPGFGGIFWAEEVTRYVSIWMVFLAAGLGVRRGIHLSADMIAMAAPESVEPYPTSLTGMASAPSSPRKNESATPVTS